MAADLFKCKNSECCCISTALTEHKLSLLVNRHKYPCQHFSGKQFASTYYLSYQVSYNRYGLLFIIIGNGNVFTAEETLFTLIWSSVCL